MAEPVQGIRAVPDEHNARYFHVVVAGPTDVSRSCNLLYVAGGQLRVLLQQPRRPRFSLSMWYVVIHIVQLTQMGQRLEIKIASFDVGHCIVSFRVYADLIIN